MIALIATISAAIGTVLLWVANHTFKRPCLKLYPEIGWQYAQDVPVGPFVKVNVVNCTRGSHVEKIEDFGFRNSGGREGVDIYSAPLPYKLKPGESIDFWMGPADVLQALAQSGYSENAGIKFFVKNRKNKAFCSKRFIVDMNEWAAGIIELE